MPKTLEILLDENNDCARHKTICRYVYVRVLSYDPMICVCESIGR